MSHKEVLVLLCFVGLSLVFCEPMKVFAQTGKSIDLPCHLKDSVEWKKDDKLILKLRGSISYGSPEIGYYSEHYKLPFRSDNMTMKINGVTLSDAGRYTCSGQGGRIENLQLSVFEIKASATTLLTSDNLTLSLLIAPEKSSDFQVTWESPNAPLPDKKFNLEVLNVSQRHTGTYKCHVSQQGTKAILLTVDIFVAGFRSGPDSQYMSSGSPLYIPWNFNFPIRDSQPWRGIKAVMGNVSYSPGNTEPFSTLLELRVSDTGTCWPENCAEKPRKGTEMDLGLTVTKPGHYLMAVWLKLGEKIKPFQRKVCLPRLIVSASPSILITWDINTTLHCQTSCHVTNGVLQWIHDKEIRAERQENSLPLDVAPHLVNMGIWTCILSINKETKMSENITLEIKPLITLGSGMPFWLIVGASIFLLVVVVLSICLLRSHCRRKRLAQRRVWLLQSLRQHRTCKCKRFSPELREIY